MKRRARLWLVTGFLLLLAAALVVWAGRKNDNADVALVFIGFTNQSFALETNVIVANGFFGRPDGVGSIVIREVKFPVALLLATNSGLAPVMLYATIVRPAVPANASVLQWSDDFTFPLTNGLPRTLKPGEAAIVQVLLGTRSRPWQTGLSYQRQGFREQLYAKAWSSGNSIIRGLLSSVYSGPGLVPVSSGPITNLPPREPPILPSGVSFIRTL